MLANHTDLTEIAASLARREFEASREFENLRWRPVTTLYDAAVGFASGHIQIPDDDDSNTDTILIWTNGPSKAPHLSQLGGTPFMDRKDAWPVRDDGSPALFFCQLYLDSTEQKHKGFDLPGDIMYVFDKSHHQSSKRYRGTSITDEDLEIRWGSTGAVYENGQREAPESGVLPFEYVASVIRIAKPISTQGSVFASRLLAREFKSSETSSNDPAFQKWCKRGSLEVFAQLASMDLGSERSGLFPDEPKYRLKKPYSFGPISFADLGSLIFLMGAECSTHCICTS